MVYIYTNIDISHIPIRKYIWIPCILSLSLYIGLEINKHIRIPIYPYICIRSRWRIFVHHSPDIISVIVESCPSAVTLWAAWSWHVKRKCQVSEWETTRILLIKVICVRKVALMKINGWTLRVDECTYTPTRTQTHRERYRVQAQGDKCFRRKCRVWGKRGKNEKKMKSKKLRDRIRTRPCRLSDF